MIVNSKKDGHSTGITAPIPSEALPETDTDAFDEPLTEDAAPGINMPKPGLKPPPAPRQKTQTKMQTMRLPQELIDALESTLKQLNVHSVQGITKSDLMRALLSMGVENTAEALRTSDTSTIIEVLTWTGTEYKES